MEDFAEALAMAFLFMIGAMGLITALFIIAHMPTILGLIVIALLITLAVGIVDRRYEKGDHA